MSDDDLWSATRPGTGSALPPPGWQPPGPPPPPPPSGYGASPYGNGGSGGRPPWFIFALVLGVVAIGAGIWLAARSGDDDSPPDAARTTDETDAATDPASDTGAPTTAAGSAPATSPPTPATTAPVDFTLPPAPTNPSTTTTLPPESTAPPTSTSPPSSAPRVRRNPQRQLDVYLGSDYPVIEGLQGSWVVQLSAKRPGLEADGIVYDVSDVLANHEMLREEYGAVLGWSGDWVYDVTDLYVTVIPTPHPTGEDALAVCRQLGFDRENCLAKKITTDRNDENTTEYLP